MNLLQTIFLALLGLSAGMIVAGGVFSFIVELGVISDFADRTHTGNHILIYEDMVAAGAIQNSFWFGSQKNYTSVFLHLNDITFSHWSSTAAGNHDIRFGLHFDKKVGFQVTEILFAIYFKNIGNSHTFSFSYDLIHLDYFHCKGVF